MVSRIIEFVAYLVLTYITLAVVGVHSFFLAYLIVLLGYVVLRAWKKHKQRQAWQEWRLAFEYLDSVQQLVTECNAEHEEKMKDPDYAANYWLEHGSGDDNEFYGFADDRADKHEAEHRRLYDITNSEYDEEQEVVVIEAPQPNMTRYAGYEGEFLNIYENKDCTKFVCRIPRHYSNCPVPGDKTITINCADYALEWVE
jgi:hypothetical protein